MPYWDNGHMDAGWGIAMGLGMLGFWVLLGLGITWAVRTSHSHSPHAVTPSAGKVAMSAQQILAERLAHGDIELEDYQSRLAALVSSR